MKTLDDYFNDWESRVFGFGYGSGEEYIAAALKTFMEELKEGRSYDYRRLEERIGYTAAWLLINTLCHADIIEYGTSPRFGWLTKYGEALRDYTADKTGVELADVMMRTYEEQCYPDHCNCGLAQRCHNPFWREVHVEGDGK